MADDWIVFSVKAQAETAVRQIDVKLALPKPGRNGGDGQPAAGKVGTVTWAEPVARTSDGKWTFPACPDAEPDRPYTSEPYDPAWFAPPAGTGATGPGR